MARERNYAAERAAARARAAALGLSPSAALGKPRKGETGKRAAGLDTRSKQGRAAAEAAAKAAGNALAPAPTIQTAHTKAGSVSSSSSATYITKSINSLRDSRSVNVVIETRDRSTGATRYIEPWRRGGINAGTLKDMVAEAGGLVEAILEAGVSGAAGTTDIDALESGDIVAVSVAYK